MSTMSGKKRTRSTAQQLTLLTDFMQTHPRLAHGEFCGPQGRLTENRQWEELRVMLSEHGPDKSIDQWKVTWRDLRRKARTEGSVARRAANSTGNVIEVPILTAQTKKILGIMGTDGAFGIQGGEESGIGETPAALADLPAPVPYEEIIDESESFTHNPWDEVVGSSNTVQESLQETARDASQQEQQSPGLPQQNQRERTTATRIERQQCQRRHQQEPRARSVQFLEAGLQNNNILRTTTTRIERQQCQRRRQQEPRARTAQFLEAELENNNILRNIANQLEIANRHRSIRSRFTYKEKLWRLRKDLLK